MGQWVLGDAWSASRQTEVHAISSMRMMMMQCMPWRAGQTEVVGC